MAKVRAALGISADGFGAGPDQSLNDPLGKRGRELHDWQFSTRTFQTMIGREGGSEGVDNDFCARSMRGFGAFIMGRNMFGPIRGDWPAEAWDGWWGPNPPYHAPVFVLTHHPRKTLVMEGGNSFHFVSGSPEEVLAQAKAAAGDLDVKIAGGMSTVRQYLRAGLIEELHFAISPVFLGRGESLLEGFDLPALGFSVTEKALTDTAMHVVLTKG